MKEKPFRYKILFFLLSFLILFSAKFPNHAQAKVKKVKKAHSQSRVQNKVYTVKKGDNLWEIAKRFRVDVEELKRINGLKGTDLKPGQKLKIPGASAKVETSDAPKVDYLTYRIKKGDTLFSIAKKHGVSVEEIIKINGVSSHSLKVGQVIKIPVRSQRNEEVVLASKPSIEETKSLKTGERLTQGETKGEAKKIYHKVKRGETIFRIARLYNTTVEEIRRLNQLKSHKLKVGQLLLVSIQNPSREDESQGNYKYHIVQEGETLYRISLMYNVPLEVLKEVNHLESNILYVGQKLKIPVAYLEREAPFVLEKPKGLSYEREDTLSQKFEKNLLPKKDILTPSMLSKEEEKALKQKFLEISLNFADQRYRIGGNGNGYLDCSAFVKLVYEAFGIKLPRSSMEQYQVGVPVEKEELIPGDLVFFKTRGNRISHVGIYIGDKRFIHISSSRKRVAIDSLDDPYFKERYVGAKRVLNGEVYEYFQEYLNKENKETKRKKENKEVKSEEVLPEVNI